MIGREVEMGIFGKRKSQEELKQERKVQHSQHVACSTREHALHLLDLIETRYDVHSGIASAFSTRGCTSSNEDHWNTTRLDPYENPRTVTCVVDMDTVSQDDQDQLVDWFKQRGFKVDKHKKHSCGCLTFRVHPRYLPG